VSGWSGKPLFCKSVMQLKMSTDGLAGMLLPHIVYAYALFKTVFVAVVCSSLDGYSNM